MLSLSLSLSLPHTHTHTPKTFPKTWFPSSNPKSSKREHLCVALRPTKRHAHLDNFSPATYRFLFLEVVAKLRRTSADRFLICHPRDAEVDEHWIMLGWRKERKRRRALIWRWKKRVSSWILTPGQPTTQCHPIGWLVSSWYFNNWSTNRTVSSHRLVSLFLDFSTWSTNHTLSPHRLVS